MCHIGIAQKPGVFAPASLSILLRRPYADTTAGRAYTQLVKLFLDKS
jgi:hypothetical protein